MRSSLTPIKDKEEKSEIPTERYVIARRMMKKKKRLAMKLVK